VDSNICFNVDGQATLLSGNSVPGEKARHRVDKAPQSRLISLTTLGATQTCVFTRPRTGDGTEDITLIVPQRGEKVYQYLVWAWGTASPPACNEAVCPEGNVQLKNDFPYRYSNHGAANRGSEFVVFFDPDLQPTEPPLPAEDMTMMMGIIGAGAAVVLGSAFYFVSGNKKPKDMSRMQFARASMGFGGGPRSPSAFGPGFGAAPGALPNAPPPPPGMGMPGSNMDMGMGGSNMGMGMGMGGEGSFSEPPVMPPPKPAGLFARASALVGGFGARVQSFGGAMGRMSMAPQAFGFGGGGGGNMNNANGSFLGRPPSMFKNQSPGPGGGGPGVWKAAVDQTTGVQYYYNKTQNRSTWKKPPGVFGI
jgi:hypothetical protein